MSAYLDWKVGDKVACLSDHGKLDPVRFKYVRKGGVYTIREIVDFDGALCLLVQEIHNQAAQTVIGFREPGFNIERFRKIHARKTDISIFEAMLTGARPKVPA